VNDNVRRRQPADPDLILHPVRMRIVTALAAGAPSTAAELAERLGDVPPATLYRHLNVMWRGGILEVADERRVRGATERRFALGAHRADLTQGDLAGAPRDQQMRWFATFLASLLGAFGRYLQRGEPEFARDAVGYREVVMNLDDGEVVEMATALNAALAPYLAKEPGPGRAPRLLATIFMPTEGAVDRAAMRSAREGSS
jgi:DNA-binding transcriptional ArsR family regulator